MLHKSYNWKANTENKAVKMVNGVKKQKNRKTFFDEI